MIHMYPYLIYLKEEIKFSFSEFNPLCKGWIT